MFSSQNGQGLRPTWFRHGSLVVALCAAFVLLWANHTSPRAIGADLTVPLLLLLVGTGAVGLFDAGVAQEVTMAPLIAIVGTDGSGKSTLSASVRVALAGFYQVEVAYLGLGTGDLGNRIKSWPMIGAALERILSKKAKQTRTREARIPGLLTALVVFGFSLLRLRRFKQMLALRRRGVIVITDRYPQTEIAGFYDGPGLSAARAGSPIVAWLAARERRIYEWMASYRPSVVLRLNIDAASAYARKPDHGLELLREKVRVTPLLRFNGARIVDIDAVQPYGDVRRQALQSIRPVIAPRSGLSAIAA